MLEFLQRRMLEILLFEAIFSLLLGLYVPSLTTLKTVIPLFVFFMILQPMYVMNFSILMKEWKRKFKLLLLVAILYSIVYPLLTFLFALLWPFTGLSPELIAGAVITALAPVAMPAPAFVASLKGDVELSIASIILTFTLSLVVIPLWSSIILHTLIKVPVFLILKSVLLYIVLPLIVARFLRSLTKGREERVNKILLALSLISMYFLVATVFINAAKILISLGLAFILFIVTVYIYHGCRFGIMDLASRVVRARKEERIALLYASTVNGALGMAVSLGAYGSVAAAGAIITGPLSVLVLMIALARLLASP